MHSEGHNPGLTLLKTRLQAHLDWASERHCRTRRIRTKCKKRFEGSSIPKALKMLRQAGRGVRSWPAARYPPLKVGLVTWKPQICWEVDLARDVDWKGGVIVLPAQLLPCGRICHHQCFFRQDIQCCRHSKPDLESPTRSWHQAAHLSFLLFTCSIAAPAGGSQGQHVYGYEDRA